MPKSAAQVEQERDRVAERALSVELPVQLQNLHDVSNDVLPPYRSARYITDNARGSAPAFTPAHVALLAEPLERTGDYRGMFEDEIEGIEQQATSDTRYEWMLPTDIDDQYALKFVGYLNSWRRNQNTRNMPSAYRNQLNALVEPDRPVELIAAQAAIGFYGRIWQQTLRDGEFDEMKEKKLVPVSKERQSAIVATQGEVVSTLRDLRDTFQAEVDRIDPTVEQETEELRDRHVRPVLHRYSLGKAALGGAGVFGAFWTGTHDSLLGAVPILGLSATAVQAHQRFGALLDFQRQQDAAGEHLTELNYHRSELAKFNQQLAALNKITTHRRGDEDFVGIDALNNFLKSLQGGSEARVDEEPEPETEQDLPTGREAFVERWIRGAEYRETNQQRIGKERRKRTLIWGSKAVAALLAFSGAYVIYDNDAVSESRQVRTPAPATTTTTAVNGSDTCDETNSGSVITSPNGLKIRC